MEINIDSKTDQRIHSIFLKHNGVLRASEAFAEGIYSKDLYALRDKGVIQAVSRGLFRLKSLPPLESPSLFIIATKIPNGVISLASALFLHKLVDQMPEQISVSLLKGSQRPRIENLSVKYYWISEPAFSEGIEIYKQDGEDLRVYCAEKTLTDCFKFRNQIGLELCIGALRKWTQRNDKNPERLLTYMKVCRMEKVMKPYLDVLLAPI